MENFLLPVRAGGRKRFNIIFNLGVASKLVVFDMLWLLAVSARLSRHVELQPQVLDYLALQVVDGSCVLDYSLA